MNGPLKFLTARKILPSLDLLAKFKRVLTCSCSPNFCVAHKHAKQIFYFCSCSQKNRSARHARECSQRPLVTPSIGFLIEKCAACQSHLESDFAWITFTHFSLLNAYYKEGSKKSQAILLAFRSCILTGKPELLLYLLCVCFFLLVS